MKYKNRIYSYVLAALAILISPLQNYIYPQATNTEQEELQHLQKAYDYLRDIRYLTPDKSEVLYEKAMKEFKIVVDINPNNKNAWEEMSSYYYKANNLDEYIRCEKKVITLSTNKEEKIMLWFMIANMMGIKVFETPMGYQRINLKYLHGAEEAYLNLIQLHKGDLTASAETYTDMGGCYAGFRQYKKAEQSYKKAIEIYKKLKSDEKVKQIEYAMLNMKLISASERSDYEGLSELQNSLKTIQKSSRPEEKIDNSTDTEHKLLLELDKVKNNIDKNLRDSLQPNDSEETAPINNLLTFYLDRTKHYPIEFHPNGTSHDSKEEITDADCRKVVELIDEMGYNLVSQSIYSSNIENSIINCYRRVKDWKHLIEFIECRLNSYNRSMSDTELLDYLGECYSNILSDRSAQTFKTEQHTMKFDAWQIEFSSDNIKTVEISGTFPSTGYVDKEYLNIGKDNWNGGNGIFRVLANISLPKDFLESNINVEHAYLFLCRQGGGISQLAAYRIKSKWESNEANWLERTQGAKWDVPGGDFSEKPLAAAKVMEVPDISGVRSVGDIQRLDIREFIQDLMKHNENGFVIKELLEDKPQKRASGLFYGHTSNSVNSIKLVIIFSGDINADLKNEISTYENTWLELYSKGISALFEKDLGKTISTWAEAAKVAKDDQIKSKVIEHMKIIAEYINNHPDK